MQKTTSAVVTIDLSKYVQPQTPSDEDENTDTPSVTTATVSLKVGDNTFGGGSYDVTTSPQITIYGKGNMSVSLIINGTTKITKDIDFNTQTTLAFP